MMSETELFDALKGALGDGLVATQGKGLDAAARVARSRTREALVFLKNTLGFGVLIDLTAVDLLRWPESQPIGVWDPCQATQGTHWKLPDVHEGRFELTYRLLKLDAASGLPLARLAVKCRVSEGGEAPPTVRDLWPVADWLEREVWDMFGVKPSDRPEIKRLLLYEEFKGHPLRKDYPINKRQPLIAPLAAPSRPLGPEDLRPKVTP